MDWSLKSLTSRILFSAYAEYSVAFNAIGTVLLVSLILKFVPKPRSYVTRPIGLRNGELKHKLNSGTEAPYDSINQNDIQGDRSNQVRDTITKAETLYSHFLSTGVLPFIPSTISDIWNDCEEETELKMPFQLFDPKNLKQIHGTCATAPLEGPLMVTPLILAAAEGRYGAVYILLKFSDVDQKPKDSTITAIYMALLFRHTRVAELLLSKGAKLQGIDCNALHAAARSGLDDMIISLVKTYKVDPNVLDMDGIPPVVYALQLPKKQAVQTISLLHGLGASDQLELERNYTFRDLCSAVGKEFLAGIFETQEGNK